MLPQEVRESYAWNDSYFREWIRSSPDASSYLQTDDISASRRIRIPDLLSSPSPARSVMPLLDNAIILDSTDEPTRNLVRSPRSSDLAGLCRRTSTSIAGEGLRDINAKSDGSCMLELDQRGTKGKGKAKAFSTSEDYNAVLISPEEEWNGPWKSREMHARSLEACQNNYDDRDFDMNYTDEYRRAKTYDDDVYLMSPSQNYFGPRCSPTWGRKREGTSSSDLNYDSMAIEELMNGMEVYSDTEYEQTEDISEVSRVLFGGNYSPGIGSSKSYALRADRKRKASSTDLGKPNSKKRYLANPLKVGSPAEIHLPANKAVSPNYVQGQFRHCDIANPLRSESELSMTCPIRDSQLMLYGCE